VRSGPSLANGARRAAADDGRCNVEKIAERLRVIEDGPILADDGDAA